MTMQCERTIILFFRFRVAVLFCLFVWYSVVYLSFVLCVFGFYGGHSAALRCLSYKTIDFFIVAQLQSASHIVACAASEF